MKHIAGLTEGEQFQIVYAYSCRAYEFTLVLSQGLTLIEFAGEFVGADSVNGLGTEQRGYLLLLAEERLEGLAERCHIYSIGAETAVRGLFQVVRWSGCSKGNAGNIFLVPCLQSFRPLGGIAYADHQHPCCQRVECTRVPHLEILLAEMPA